MRALVILLACAGTAAADVTVEELAARPAIATTVRAKPTELAAAMQTAMLSLIAAAQQHDLQIVAPPLARYLSRGDTFVVEAALPVRKSPAKLGKQLRAISLPAGPAAVVVVRGPHTRLASGHAELDRWLAANKRATAGARWEVYVTNPITTPDPDAQVTRIYAPLAK